MTMLSDEELAATGARYKRGEGWETGRSAFDQAFVDAHRLLSHIDALTAQRDRARDIAVSPEQELAEVADLVRWRDNQRDPGAGQVIAEFDAVAKAARLGTWSAPDGSHGVSASGPWKASEDSA